MPAKSADVAWAYTRFLPQLFMTGGMIHGQHLWTYRLSVARFHRALCTRAWGRIMPEM